MTDEAKQEVGSEHFRSLLENAEDLIAIASPQGRLLYANPALRRLLGLGDDEDLGETSVADCHPPEDAERLMRDVFGAVLRDGSWVGEVVWQGHDGRLVPTRLISKAHRGDGGEVDYCSVIAHDISELKMLNEEVSFLNTSLEKRVANRTGRLMSAQKRLSEEKERAQRYLDVAGVVLVALDPDGIVTMINRRGCELLGEEEKNIVGKNWFDEFLCSDEKENVRDAFAALKADRLALDSDFENQVVSRRGETRLISWHNTVLRESDGTTIGTLSSGEDITEQRRAEEALRAREAQLRLITDALPILVAQVDREGRYVFNNATYERFFGIPTEELHGRLARDVVGEEAFETVGPYLEQAYKGERSTFEVQLTNKDGQLRDMVVRYVPDLDASGEVVGVLAVIADITERKQLAAALRQSQKMEAIGQLASGIAHDFNNLLMGIGGCANVALSRLDDRPAVQMLLDEIRSAAAGGGGITRQLLDFSRQTEAELANLEIDAVVAQNESMFRRLLGESISLRLHLGAGKERVSFVQGQLEQIIMNLVINARDAMLGGGEIDIETRHVELDARQAGLFGGLMPGHYLTLSVRDNGHGMDAATIERVFEPFFTTKEIGKGTGLGLSTVYGIVSQRGGYVDVQSKSGCGTTVTIYLPRAHPSTVEQPDLELRARPGTETVLVVEDDRLVRFALREYLERWGYHVLEASDGVQAVQMARKYREPLPLLICDMILPGIAGSRVAAMVLEFHPEAKVIHISAHSAEMLAAAGHLAPGAEILQKPFREEELLTQVHHVLGEPREVNH